mgnify:CR=1 FL=1
MEIENRKARYDYFIEESYECGIALKGTEIKSIREGKANIKDSYGMIKDNELYILNMHIAPYEQANIFNHEEKRTRKLLAHKNEILKMKTKLNAEGYTLVPLKLYIKEGKAKILIGIAKGKKTYDKKEVIKQRDIDRYNKKTMNY